MWVVVAAKEIHAAAVVVLSALDALKAFFYVKKKKLFHSWNQCTWNQVANWLNWYITGNISAHSFPDGYVKYIIYEEIREQSICHVSLVEYRCIRWLPE